MRWKINPDLVRPTDRSHAWRGRHDTRTIDALALAALLALVICSCLYLSFSLATPPSTAAFIVPSQNVHW